MKVNRILLKVSRISGWALLVFMIIYMVSGYALTENIFMSRYMAGYLHTGLDEYMMIVFLAHVLISMKFALKRGGLHNDGLVNTALLFIGLVSYGLVLAISWT